MSLLACEQPGKRQNENQPQIVVHDRAVRILWIPNGCITANLLAVAFWKGCCSQPVPTAFQAGTASLSCVSLLRRLHRRQVGIEVVQHPAKALTEGTAWI